MLNIYLLLIQGDNPFWSKKLPQDKTEKAGRPIRPKTKVIKKPAHKRKTTASSDPAIDDDVGNPDLEVELDSLGLLFTRLIDDDACQDDAEASNAGFVEVTILSSDSEILPLPKSRRTNRKEQPGPRPRLSRNQLVKERPPLHLTQPLTMMWVIRILR